MDARKIKVRAGESVFDAWNRLVDWVESLKIQTTPDILIAETTNGLDIKVVESVTFSHPFLTMASINYAGVSPGTVNGFVPMIRDFSQKKLVRIDGRDKDGKLTTGFFPRMEIDAKKASKDGRIYICVKVKAEKAANGKPAELKNESLEIVQTDSPTGPKDQNGYYPIAMIYLTADMNAVQNVFQITHHNLRYAYQERKASDDELKAAPLEKTIGRHVFYPA